MAAVAETVQRVLRPIQQFTRGWMLSEATDRAGIDLGLPSGEDFWIIGRAGVLGDCRPDVAAAALGYISPEGVRQAWAAIPAHLSPSAVHAAYAACCTTWGRDALSTFDPKRMARLDELGRRVADGASPALGALFAGWRGLAQPTHIGERVALTTQVLREMRGAAHLIAIQACGLTPLDAVLASPAPPPRRGPEWARHLRWTGPFRDADELRPARIEAETLTSTIMERHLSVLDADELDEFGEIVETTRHAIPM